MTKIKVAINGLGRVGRAFFKLAVNHPEFDLVAVNDLGELDNLIYLLKYDSAYGRSGLKFEARSGELVVGDKSVKFLQIKNPAELPWASLGVAVVVEATGRFESYEGARGHLTAGAHKVVVTGINDEQLGRTQISSNASCTTNAASPLIQILHEKIGIEKALLNTVHAYTASQRLVDSPDAKDWRRGRAAAANIIPSTTGAAISVTEAIPDLKNKFDGIALRVPLLTGSIADITFISKRPTSGAGRGFSRPPMSRWSRATLLAAPRPRWLISLSPKSSVAIWSKSSLGTTTKWAMLTPSSAM